MGMDEFPSRLRVRSVYECLRRNGRIHEVCRILVKEADESGVEGPSKSSNCSLFSLQSGMEEEEEGWKGRRALPVQSVCRVTIVEKCSFETRRKNRLAMGKKRDRLRETRLPLLAVYPRRVRANEPRRDD